MRRFFTLALTALLATSQPAFSQLSLADEWVNEADMKKQSRFAQRHNLLLVSLSCKFDDTENPGRENVLFKPLFEVVDTPTPWGWTFDANAPLPGPEIQARQAGFEIASEDYFEVSGVTWVRCRVWHRP